MFRREGVELMFDEIKQSLHDFGVDFDVYFHENSLHESGAVDKVVAELKESGRALLRRRSLVAALDRLRRRQGPRRDQERRQPAYIAGDLAYLRDKRARGFDLCIYMLGADHHGYIGRLKAAAAAFGDDPDVVEVLIGQLVNLVKDGEPVRMSKRAGNVITLEDLVDAVGVDAARYCARTVELRHGARHRPRPARQAQQRQPGVLRAVRARADEQRAAQRRVGVGIGLDEFDPELLDHPADTALLGALGEFPRIVASAAELRAPHRVAHYLEALAATYHRWYDTDECRVLPKGDEPITTANRTRLWLNEATRIVLANGLRLLGVSAPERM